MNPQALILSGRIETELTELRQVVDRTLQAWDKAIKQSDDYYLDSLKPEKLKLLVEKLEHTFMTASEELTAFAQFLSSH